MKRIFLSLILTAATLPWAIAALAQQDPSEAPATRPVNPVSAPQKLIFVPDSLKPYDFNKDDERWCWRHSASDVSKAVNTLRQAGINNISIDSN